MIGSGLVCLHAAVPYALLQTPNDTAVTATTLQSLTLKVRTCEERAAGTLDTLSLSFCGGESNCSTGRFNLYNSEGYLFEPGIWNELEVPLDYTPTTMVMEISDIDAW